MLQRHLQHYVKHLRWSFLGKQYMGFSRQIYSQKSSITDIWQGFEYATLLIKKMYTWNILAPYGVLQAFSKLSLPVLMNHFPLVANFNERTQLSCRWSWYLSGLLTWSTSTLLLSILWNKVTQTRLLTFWVLRNYSH